MAKKQGNQAKYTALILEQIYNLLDSREGSISLKELEKEENLKDFLYALGTVAPAILASRITPIEYDALTFNHMQNHLVFKYNKDESKTQ